MDRNYLDRIITYYKDSEISYRQGWDLKHSMAIHAGYYDSKRKTFRDALRGLNEVAAEYACIKGQEFVLDAGCGVGGSAVFLAKKFKCNVKGITLSTDQVISAQKNASKNRVVDLVSFEVTDYTDTGFADNTYDVVWAIESVCHSKDKSAFINEAFRILKPNGRLVVIDYFLQREPEKNIDITDYDFFLDSLACNNLDKPLSFREKLLLAGFSSVNEKNASENFMPNTIRLKILGNLSLLMNFAMKILGVKRSEARAKGGKTALLTSRFFKNGMLEYYIFSAHKPG